MTRKQAMLFILFSALPVFGALHAQITVQFNITNPPCFGVPTGAVTAIASGGVAPYNYAWSNGAFGPTISTLPAGTYTVTVTDFVGNSKIQSATVTQPPLLGIVFTGDTCTLPAFITASGVGGVGPYNYAWNTGHNGPSIVINSLGNYCLTLTDANGCGAIGCVKITVPPINISLNSTNLLCPGVNNGQITSTVTGGQPPYNYQWSNGATTPNLINVGAGVYTLTVTDARGCTRTATSTVTAPPPIVITLNTIRPSCTGFNNGSITASAAGGTAPYIYLWNTGATGPTINNVGAGTYTVTVTDINNCPAQQTVTITPLSNLMLGAIGTAPNCPGFNTGSAVANPSNGLPPYNFLWSNGQTTQTINNLAPGVYSVTVTDAAGCIRTASATVGTAPAFNITVTSTNVTTCGAANGTVNVVVTQGVPPFTYIWNTGATTPNLTNLGAGTYSVTVTSANNCVATGTATITAPPAIGATITATPLVCQGTAVGMATVNVVGGTAPFSFLWSNGATMQTISGLGAGTYSATVTDAFQCQAFATATIQSAPVPTVSINATPVVCGTNNTGTATATGAGGTPPYSYLWNTGATTPTIAGLTTGTYVVTLTDLNGCRATASTSITVFDDLVATIAKTNVDCFGASTGSATATATGGQAPYAFTWSNGAVGSVITNLPAGFYTVTVRDVNGCMTTATTIIGQPAQLNVSFTANSALVCVGASTGTLTASATGGTAPYSYLWNTGATTPAIANLPAGTYSVTVTDLEGCTATGSYTFFQAPVLEVTIAGSTVVCGQENGGAATVVVSGGTGPFTYLWNTGANTESIANLGSGAYSVTVTDVNGCSDTAEIGILVITDLTMEVTPRSVLCFGGNSGSALAVASGGTAPYTYVWSNGVMGPELLNATAGTYSVTATEVNGCTVSRTITITQPTQLQATVTGVNAPCFGGTGSVSVTAVGGTAPYTYLWNNGATTAQVTGITAGTYMVTVTDVNLCTATAQVTITQASSLTANINAVQILCNGANTGSATATATGGTPPYSFLWNNGQTTPAISNLAPGIYNVTVTDLNGCDDIAGVQITQPPLLAVTITQVQGTCQGASNGVLMAIASGGTGAYTFLWSGGGTGATRSNLAAGTHTVTVTDANGCTATATATITAFPNPTCSISLVSDVIFGNDGALTVSATGGTAPYSFLWSNGATTQTITGLNGGVYSATVTDANGCTSTCSFNLIARSGLGDFVWEDIDKDGIQDANEPGVPNIKVRLKNAAGVVIDSTFTDAGGRYSFVGLVPGTYSVQFVIQYPYLYTLLNRGGNDALDSDADSTTMLGMTPNVTLAPGEFNPTLDAGIYVRPQIDDSDPCICLNNSTTETNGQFSEVITIFSYPGENWVLFNPMNLYLTSSPPPPGIPILATGVIPFVEVAPGTYQAAFILLHEMPYSARFTNGVDTLGNGNVCRYPTINLSTVPPNNLCIAEEPIIFSGVPSVPGTLTFFVNGVQVDSIVPGVLPIGTYEFVAYFTPSDPRECETTVRSIFHIVNDCFAKLGDRAWRDDNANGIQDPGEVGVPNVKVVVTGMAESTPYSDTTFTDHTGMYMFLLPPGEYKLTFMLPPGSDLVPTVQNAGSDDAIDSDPDTVMLMTEIITLDPYEMDMTWDIGFVPPCINITAAGNIGPAYQFLCGPGNIPAPLTNVTLPSGGTVTNQIEYMWMRTYTNSPFDSGFWEIMPNSNSPSYQPGPLYQSAYFARCARRVECGPFIESNVVFVEVGTVSVANITGPEVVCLGDPATFSASGTAPGAVIQWSFGPGVSPNTATGSPVTVNFSSFGSFLVTLTVTQNGCTASNFRYITVTDNPTFCMGNIQLDAEVTAAREVALEWSLQQGVPYTGFRVERSADGRVFQSVATVNAPWHTGSGMLRFAYDDASPKYGRNYYRVIMIGTDGLERASNVAEAIIYGDSKLVLLYPNPVTDHVVLELFETFNGAVQVDVVTASGMVAKSEILQPNTPRLEMDFSSYPAGVYFLRVRYGELELKRLKVLKL
ncbi:MAG TPA: SdrD B-like domain-containing protein [Saprospiraceae bacterium]|nr:SdrD B-like domain-containing protein [Saprospiraceae bacterium]